MGSIAERWNQLNDDTTRINPDLIAALEMHGVHPHDTVEYTSFVKKKTFRELAIIAFQKCAHLHEGIAPDIVAEQIAVSIVEKYRD